MPIISKIMESLLELILKNLYKKICRAKYAKKKIIEFNITCIQNASILNIVYIVKLNIED